MTSRDSLAEAAELAVERYWLSGMSLEDARDRVARERRRGKLHPQTAPMVGGH